MRSGPTLHSIAAECGVSHVTVWRALRHHPNVHPSTAEKIRTYAGDVGYTVDSDARVGSRHARGPKQSRASSTILIPYNKNAIARFGTEHLFWDYVEGIIDAGMISAPQPRVLLAGFEDADSELECIKNHVENGIDGILNFGFLPETLTYLAEKNVPVVSLLTSRYQGRPDGPSVNSDHIRGFFDSWIYLLDLGHRKVGFIGYDGSADSESRLQEILAAASLIGDRASIATAINIGIEDTTEILWRILIRKLGAWSRETWPSAFFCANDQAAHRLTLTLKEHGVAIPKDISIIGFDNSPISRDGALQITTIGNPRNDIGAAMLHLLENLIEKRPGSATASQTLPMQLLKRDTVAQIIE